MSAEHLFKQYAGRILINGAPTGIVKIPPTLLEGYSEVLRDTFGLVSIDFERHGSISATRILKELTNGNCVAFEDFFADLISAENIPDLPTCEIMVKEEVARWLKANPQVPIVSAKDFLAEKITETPSLIKPFFPSPGRVVLAGYSGVGKTSFALNMLASISAGQDFLGWATRKTTSLLIDGENPRQEIQKRVRTIFKAMGGNLDNFHLAFPEKRINLLQDQGLKQLERTICSSGAGLVFLDSFLNFFSVRNENDSSEVRPALDRLTLLSRALQCSVVIVDHTMKPPRDTRYSALPTPRGSGAKVDWADAVLCLEEKKAEGRYLRTLHFTKTRVCAPIPPVTIELDGALVFSRADENALVPTALVVEIVRDSPGISSSKLNDAIRERVEVSRSTVLRALDRLMLADNSPILRKTHGNRHEYYPASLMPEIVSTGAKNE